LFDRDNPLNPVNRRIDIVVLTKKAQRNIEGEAGEEASPALPSRISAPPADEPLQPEQLRERLNIFEDGVLNFDQP
jgi:chemotaxis protein MotB